MPVTTPPPDTYIETNFTINPGAVLKSRLKENTLIKPSSAAVRGINLRRLQQVLQNNSIMQALVLFVVQARSPTHDRLLNPRGQ
jgi:hypothetical protein